MALLIAFVAADLLGGLYLLAYAYRHQRWERPSVPLLGVVLLVLSTFLALLAVRAIVASPSRQHVPPGRVTPPPRGEVVGTSAAATQPRRQTTSTALHNGP